MTLAPTPRRTTRSLHLGLFALAALWIIVANRVAEASAQGITNTLPISMLGPLLQPLFLIFLLVLGLLTIARLHTRIATARSVTRLPQRATSAQEFQRGLALGWAITLAAVLPMVLTGALHPDLSLGMNTWLPTLVSLAVIAIGTLAAEIAFRGYLYAQLTGALGNGLATLIVSFVYAAATLIHPHSTFVSFVIAFFASVLLCVTWQRTHGLWLSWGLHFGWAATTAVLLGLPTAGDANLSTLLTTSASGPDWLTGGVYGPDGALPMFVVRLLAIVVLYRITRDYAWAYTHPEIVSAGHPMDIAPPAAHTAMENAAPAPLVQILGATPTAASTLPVIDDHLRASRDADAPPTIV